MAQRIRVYDWARTPLGAIEVWPQSLKTVVALMLGSPLPAAVAWGPDLTVLYNDGYEALIGTESPLPLGRPFIEVAPEPEGEEISRQIRRGEARHTVDRYQDIPVRPEQPFGWFTSSWTPLRDETGDIVGVYLSTVETTDRVLVERTLRAREVQHAFLLKLSDALRFLAATDAIQSVACQLLSEHLNTTHTYYVDIREGEGIAVIDQDHVRDGATSLEGTYSLDVLHWVVPLYKRDCPVVVDDMRRTDLVPEAERLALAASGIVAWIAIPLVKRGELVGALCVVRTEPYAWSEADVAIVAETGERIWAAMERARAEKAAREADMRLRTMADTAPVLMWNVAENGALSVNERYLEFFGVGADAIRGGGWHALIHPDDARDNIAAYEDALKDRRPFTYEARLRRADGQYRWLSTFGQPIGEKGYVGVSIDITERRQAEERVRRNNAVLQAINLIFSETLGASSEEEVARISLDVAEELTGSAIAFLGEIDDATGRLEELFFSDRTRAQFAAGTAANADRMPKGKMALGLAIHGIYGRVLRDGEGLIVNEPASHPDSVGTPEGHLPLRAFLGVPLKQGEKTRGMIGLGNRVGGFRPEDLEAAEALAPAIWHALRSKRAELRLRESDQRFRQFAEASSDVLWIREAPTLTLEFVSPALWTIYGIAPSAIDSTIQRWAAQIVPDDRDAVLQNLGRACAGEPVVHEFRIKRVSDGAFRWIHSTLFPLRDEQGRVRRVGGVSSDVTEAKLLTQHQAVLLAELQHRVRNIMAVTCSIATRTGERAETVADYASLVTSRLLTLARVQALLTRSPNARVPVAVIVHDEVSAQALRAEQYDLSGPEIDLSPKAAEILTLAVHELATNALKYGALAVPDGRVRVRWTTFAKRGESWFGFDWAEDGGLKADRPEPAPAAPHGFGRELIEGRLPYELGGRGKLTIGPTGARCRLEFPLREGASILETDAPLRATVFGGALDMTGEADLSGHRILVVEDDYYLATDTARALQGVGAEVIGPCPSEEAARDALAESRPTAVLVDINLGDGPSFALARLLRETGLPFIFITGYDEGVIPSEFADVERLQKPVELRRIVSALAETLGS